MEVTFWGGGIWLFEGKRLTYPWWVHQFIILTGVSFYLGWSLAKLSKEILFWGYVVESRTRIYNLHVLPKNESAQVFCETP